MEKNIKTIYQQFDGKLIGKPKMKIYVCETVSKMPPNIVAYVTKHCWFVSSMKDAWAFAFTGNDIANQHLIFLSDDLLHQDWEQISFTIAHEIGHVMLNHKNSVERIQSQREIKQQEIEADEFARQFIR
jgi:Zn-dependent protease with chaperone function